MKAVALDNTLEAAAFRDSRNLYELALGKHCYIDNSADLNACRQLFVALRVLFKCCKCFAFSVANLRFVGVRLFFSDSADLYSVVALLFFCLYLSDYLRGSFNEGRCISAAVFRKYGSHLTFCSKDEFHVVV